MTLPPKSRTLSSVVFIIGLMTAAVLSPSFSGRASANDFTWPGNPSIPVAPTTTATSTNGGVFEGVTNRRIFDSRVTTSDRPAGRVTFDAYASIPYGPQSFGGISNPALYSAFALNVTVTNAIADGFVTVSINGPQPPTSSINFVKGETRANFIVMPSNGSTSIHIRSNTHVDVVLDWVGSFRNDNPAWMSFGSYASVTPYRIVDTRPESLNADYTDALIGPTTDKSFSRVRLQDAVHLNPGDGAASYAVLSVTGVGAAGPTYIAETSNKNGVPTSSNLNFGAGDVASNLVLAPVYNSEYIYTHASTHFVIDVIGYFKSSGTAGGRYYSTTQDRILDTRSSSGRQGDGVLIYSPGVYDFNVTSQAAVQSASPAVKTIIGNATVVAETATFVRIWNGDKEMPNTSNLNAPANKPTPGAAWSEVSSSGSVRAYLNSRGRLIYDVQGYFG